MKKLIAKIEQLYFTYRLKRALFAIDMPETGAEEAKASDLPVVKPRHCNQDRLLTIVFTIREPEKAEWIWEALKAAPEVVHGIELHAIQNGNVLDEIRKLEEELDDKN